MDELDALLGESKGATSDAELDALLGSGDNKVAEPSQKGDPRLAAYDSAIKDCQGEYAKYTSIKKRIDGGVVAYRTIEGLVASGIKFGVSQIKQVLVLLIVICGVITTLRRHHISPRPAKTGVELVVSEGSQLIVNLCPLIFCMDLPKPAAR